MDAIISYTSVRRGLIWISGWWVTYEETHFGPYASERAAKHFVKTLKHKVEDSRWITWITRPQGKP